VVGLEPSVVGMSALRRWVEKCFQCFNFNQKTNKPDVWPGCKKISDVSLRV
jgi:hypothetical protein